MTLGELKRWAAKRGCSDDLKIVIYQAGSKDRLFLNTEPEIASLYNLTTDNSGNAYTLDQRSHSGKAELVIVLI